MTSSISKTLPWIACLLLGAQVASPAADLTNFADLYTKYEYRIPMRDGVRLFTVVYTPKDTSNNYPILLRRTIYDLKPYTIDDRKNPGLPESYVREKFIFALQDARGRYASEGQFDDMRPHIPNKRGPKDVDESSDAFDTIEWLVRNVRNHNGRVGAQGISYSGFLAACAAIDSHPALKAVSPQAPCIDMAAGDDVLHGGAFWLAHIFSLSAFLGTPVADPLRQEAPQFDYGTPDGYSFFLKSGGATHLTREHFPDGNAFWENLLANVTNSTWLQARNLAPHLKGSGAAVLTVGGWFDAENLHGALNCYRSFERQNPGIYNGLVMGPWTHGTWHGTDEKPLDNIEFYGKPAKHFRENIELPFFREYLKGTGQPPAEAFIFETGTDQWRQFETWPPTNAVRRALYLRGGGTLSFDQDTARRSFDEYTSDPNRPVPYTSRITTAMAREYMVEDQRFAARRPDVLVYQTEPLEEDVTVAGPIPVRFHVSTSGTDADFVVKLIDVYTPYHPDPDPNPSGVRMGEYQQLVRAEPLRAKYRNGLDRPEALTAGKITALQITLPDICHTFRRGHRIMLQIQSTWFPLMDRNPQRFTDIYHAAPQDYQPAQHRVYRSGDAASHLELPVLQ